MEIVPWRRLEEIKSKILDGGRRGGENERFEFEGEKKEQIV